MNNKFKIIETEDYILAVYNEDIKIKLRYLYNKIRKDIKETYNDFDEKIIAYQSKGNAPELDLPLLPEIVLEDLKNMDEQPEEISDEDWDVFVKNLKQPKTPKWFIVEMEEIHLKDPNTCEHVKHVGCIKDICTCYTLVPKTQEISGKAYLVGKYVNE